jgi:hypothetical protein
MSERFAHPAHRLPTASTLPGPTVTPQPAPGNAVALGPDGRLPSGIGIIKGQVDSTGAAIGGDTPLFVSAKTATGIYTVTFGNAAFAAAPTVILTVGHSNIYVAWSSKTATGFTVTTTTVSTGAAFDSAFDFVAFG